MNVNTLICIDNIFEFVVVNKVFDFGILWCCFSGRVQCDRNNSKRQFKMTDNRASTASSSEDQDSPTSPSSRKRTPSKFAVKLPPPPSSTYGIKTVEIASNSTNSVNETNNNSVSSFSELKSSGILGFFVQIFQYLCQFTFS